MHAPTGTPDQHALHRPPVCVPTAGSAPRQSKPFTHPIRLILPQGSRYYDWTVRWQKIVHRALEELEPEGCRSSIYAVDQAKLLLLPPAELRAIFGRHHILFRQTPLKLCSFGQAELSQLWDAASAVELYGEPAQKHSESDGYIVARLLPAPYSGNLPDLWPS